MKPTVIIEKDHTHFEKVLIKEIKRHKYVEDIPPIDEDWFRVNVNGDDYDLCIHYDHFNDTVYNYIGVFYALNVGVDINDKKCYTTNFSNTLTFMFSSLNFSEVIQIDFS